MAYFRFFVFIAILSTASAHSLKCVSVCDGVSCKENYFANPENNCQCECKQEPDVPCSLRAFWDLKTCTCRPDCDFYWPCPPGEKWDWYECGCAVACPGVVCQEKNFFPNVDTCECECTNVAPEPCGRSWFWNQKFCECRVGCDWIEECKDGLTWDIFECGCI